MALDKEIKQFIESINQQGLPITEAQAIAFGIFCKESHPQLGGRKAPKGFLSRLVAACQFTTSSEFYKGLQMIVDHTMEQLGDSPYIAIFDEPGKITHADGTTADIGGGRSSFWVYQELLNLGLPKPYLTIGRNDPYNNPNKLEDPQVLKLPFYLFDDWAITGIQIQEALADLNLNDNIHVSLVRSTKIAKDTVRRLPNVREVFTSLPDLARMDQSLLPKDFRYIHLLYERTTGKGIYPSTWQELAGLPITWSPFKVPDCVPDVLLGTRRFRDGTPLPGLINDIMPPYAPQNSNIDD